MTEKLKLFQTTPEQYKELYPIAEAMSKASIDKEVVRAAMLLAMYYEGMYDLLKLWRDETDSREKNNIITAIKEEILESL